MVCCCDHNYVLSPNAVRLYDVNTLQCFVSSDARDQHWAVITSVGDHLTVM